MLLLNANILSNPMTVNAAGDLLDSTQEEESGSAQRTDFHSAKTESRVQWDKNEKSVTVTLDPKELWLAVERALAEGQAEEDNPESTGLEADSTENADGTENDDRPQDYLVEQLLQLTDEEGNPLADPEDEIREVRLPE